MLYRHIIFRGLILCLFIIMIFMLYLRHFSYTPIGPLAISMNLFMLNEISQTLSPERLVDRYREITSTFRFVYTLLIQSRFYTIHQKITVETPGSGLHVIIYALVTTGNGIYPFLIRCALKTACMARWRHQMETFPRYWPLVRGIHRSTLTKACDAELWCFLWSAPEQTVEQMIETPVIWDAITFIMVS